MRDWLTGDGSKNAETAISWALFGAAGTAVLAMVVLHLTELQPYAMTLCAAMLANCRIFELARHYSAHPGRRRPFPAQAWGTAALATCLAGLSFYTGPWSAYLWGGLFLLGASLILFGMNRRRPQDGGTGPAGNSQA